MTRRILLATALACLACGGAAVDVAPKPVPADKLDYVGHWQGDSVDLVIGADGMLAYENTGPNASGSMTAPITAWTDQGFSAGVSFLTMDFRVDEPPHEDAGVWKMTVDGAELTRVDEGAVEDSDRPLVLTPQ